MASDLMASVTVCDTLGIDRSTLSRWVKFGDITPALQGPGKTGTMFFRPEDVERLREEKGLAK